MIGVAHMSLTRLACPILPARSKNLTHPNIVQTYDYARQLLEVGPLFLCSLL